MVAMVMRGREIQLLSGEKWNLCFRDHQDGFPSAIAANSKFLLFSLTDAETFVQFSLRCLLFLAVFTLLYHFASQFWRQRRISSDGASPPTPVAASSDGSEQITNEDEVRQRQQRAREIVQQVLNAQSAEHYERVIKPREEAKRKKEEEEFYRFKGPAWKGKADRLGGEDIQPNREALSSVSQGAAASRKLDLPEEAKVTPKKTSTKRELCIPDEPAEGATGAVTIVLRFPGSRPQRRRFLTEHTVQMLMDFMQSVGFHQKVYSIFQTYPRQIVSDDATKTLAEVGIVSDVALNVEEIN
ncbi:hypothetical protein CAPTEDRAFT_215804 [Capitella teleta]|uniref:UBX domain-containing protein n=1 Tax=Capitella teleta TaxID=283909 RepID=R7UJW6_CAPTE|nr:hypothetical protein CAPTEDRAFT_215804 [Capitella teleta]|eukprot:ELU06844.1 hypothetical protein CAPTEDRAFT_215804 [Capitella teleta]